MAQTSLRGKNWARERNHVFSAPTSTSTPLYNSKNKSKVFIVASAGRPHQNAAGRHHMHVNTKSVRGKSTRLSSHSACVRPDLECGNTKKRCVVCLYLNLISLVVEVPLVDHDQVARLSPCLLKGSVHPHGFHNPLEPVHTGIPTGVPMGIPTGN